MSSKFRPWVLERMASGVYLSWLAITPTGEVAAGAGLWLMDSPPHMVGTQARRANIVNVYTQHAWRRQGLARRLMDVILDWCRANNLDTVGLHASTEGRPM